MFFRILLLGFTTITILCFDGKAQIPLNFGFCGGTSYSIYNENLDSLTQQAQMGWQGGVFARVKLKKWYVAADALVSSKPGKFESESGNTKGEISLIGMDIPVMVGYKVIKTKVFNLRTFVGPAMHFSFYDDIKTTYNGEKIETNNDIKFNSEAQYSGVAGLGIDVAMITFDMRYIYAFSNWSNSNEVNLNPQMLQGTIGFKIL
ncbi:MAG: outer membrane beta-barrel protein [Salibacteraceae bacterium]